jgi:hypothetical protein
MSRRVSVIAAALIAMWMIAAASPAAAHLADRVGAVEIEIGWATEPTFTGQPNAVVMFMNVIRSRSQAVPLEAGEASLSVEIIFGEKDGTQKMKPVPLEPFEFGEPGEWRSESFVPTRPGAFTFHVTGTLRGRAFDRFYTSGERGAIEGTKFDDVREIAAVSFPEKDQTNADLARALDQSRKTAAAAAQAAKDDAKDAKLFGIIGIALGAIAIVFGLRPRRKKAAS